MPTPYVGLLIDGTWQDVSSYVRYDDGITVARGHRSESGGMEQSTAALTFNNPDKRFTPDHPASVWYGLLGRNTPIRIARDTPDLGTYLYLGGSSGDIVSCPDSAGVSVTGDIEIQIDVALESWTTEQDLAGKYETTLNQRSWAVALTAAGMLQLLWSPDGTLASRITATSTAAVTADPDDRVAIKVTLDVDNGAGGNDVKFWTAATLAGPWSQLGATVTTAGATSVFDSTADVVVGDTADLAPSPMLGVAYGFRLLNGIGGSEVANPDFTVQDDQTAAFADAAGNTWTLAGTAAFIYEGPWRFHGEVAEWPPVSDITGTVVTVSIEATGLWRRLSQNEEPLDSTMRRSQIRNLDDVQQYWPLEDQSEATVAASAIPGYPGMKITGTPQLGAYDGWTASGAMPQLDSGRFVGLVPSYAATGHILVSFFLFVDENPPAETDLIIFTGSGTVRKWKVLLLANGNLRVRAYDQDDNEIDDGAGSLGSEISVGLSSLGFTLLSMHIEQDGADLGWDLVVYDFINTDTIDDSLTTAGFAVGVLSSQTVGRAQAVILNDNSNIGNTKVSHLVVSSGTVTFGAAQDAVFAYNGEGVTTRLLRLCAEEDIPLTVVAKGTSGNSVTMGDQRIKELTALLAEVEETDLGLLYETRQRLGFGYRTRLSLANQAAQVTLSHSSHELGAPLKPVSDDQRLVNDVTITRDQGSSFRAVKDSGPLSILPPAQGGVGRYPDAKTLSITLDDQLADQAGFRLRLGTEPGARYPEIVVNLHHPSITGDAALLAALEALDIGDRIVITDLPDRLPPDDISVIVRGYSERFDQFTHAITFSCVPEAPWQWAIVDDDAKRADTEGSETSGAFVSGTDTSMTVATTSGPVWVDSVTHAADFPFNIVVSGVVLTVTAISGTTSPQTFTITQTPVNGIAKTIPSGTAVELASKAYVGMV